MDINIMEKLIFIGIGFIIAFTIAFGREAYLTWKDRIAKESYDKAVTDYKVQMETKTLKMDRDDVLRFILDTIKSSVDYRRVTFFDMRGMKNYDLQTEVNVIVADVVMTFSDSFTETVKVFYSDDFLTKFIVRNVTVLLMADLKSRVDSTRSNKPTIIEV